MNAFAEYGARATSTARPRLVGVIKTKSEARARYTQIVADLKCCHTTLEVRAYLASISAEIAQHKAELEFLWSGGGDFLGLEKEIALAEARVDDGLDFPRWEPTQLATEDQ